MKKQTGFFFYILGIYVVLQFSWWGYHLIQLTKELKLSDEMMQKRIAMIIGEGLVFLILLIFGLIKIKLSIQKEQELTKRQNNFLLSVTHELKTPLASIKLLIQTLLKRKFEAEKKEELLHKVLLENDRLEEIIEAILISARIENRQISFHKEQINLTQILVELKNKYNDKLNKEWIILNFNNETYIENDLFMIKTILINLIENALKYAGNEMPLSIVLSQDNKLVTVQISDKGPGIPLPLQTKIFEKFVRLENEETRSKKGTGLGLFIVKEFVEYANGQIFYTTNQPTGSTFTLVFNKI